LARFPTQVFTNYADVWKAAAENAATSEIRGSEQDWLSTFSSICACKKTLITPPGVKSGRVRIAEHESQTLMAFKKKVDAQWEWINKPPQKLKKKKGEEERYFSCSLLFSLVTDFFIFLLLVLLAKSSTWVLTKSN